MLDLRGADIARQDDHADAALLDRGLHGQLREARHLLGRGDRADEGAAVGEDLLRSGLLEVVAADLGARDVRRDREHGRAVALAIVETVQQVQAARARTIRARPWAAPRPARPRRRRTRPPPRCARARTRCRPCAAAWRRRSDSPSRRRCRIPSVIPDSTIRSTRASATVWDIPSSPIARVAPESLRPGKSAANTRPLRGACRREAASSPG